MSKQDDHKPICQRCAHIHQKRIFGGLENVYDAPDELEKIVPLVVASAEITLRLAILGEQMLRATKHPNSSKFDSIVMSLSYLVSDLQRLAKSSQNEESNLVASQLAQQQGRANE